MGPLWNDAHNDVQVVHLTEPKEIDALIRLFEAIAQEERWEPGDALRFWQPRSVYFALEVSGRMVGGLQLVLPDAGGSLPCQSVWPETSVETSAPCAHIAILALEGSVRGQNLLFWRLVVEMWRHCVGTGLATLFIEVTPRVLPLYRRLGWPLQMQGELRRHWGEECYLCSLGIPDVAEALLRRAQASDYYRQIVAQAFRVTLAISIPKRAEREALHVAAG